jgi:hypothetical protein
MNLLLVLMLGGLWAAILLTGVLGDRRPRSPIASVDDFERLMDTLAPLQQMPAPDDEGVIPIWHPPTAPRPSPRAAALRRRQQIFRALAAAVPGTFALALLFGTWAWLLPAVSTTALVTYCTLLVHLRRRADHRARVVRPLDRPTHQTPETPTRQAGEA